MAQNKRSYTQLSQELAAIIDWFESDEVELDSAIAKYEQAMELIDKLEKYLKSAENKIQKITIAAKE
jgi:exodeoxyribonuclease VII small subunit